MTRFTPIDVIGSFSSHDNAPGSSFAMPLGSGGLCSTLTSLNDIVLDTGASGIVAIRFRPAVSG